MGGREELINGTADTGGEKGSGVCVLRTQPLQFAMEAMLHQR